MEPDAFAVFPRLRPAKRNTGMGRDADRRLTVYTKQARTFRRDGSQDLFEP